MSDMASQTVTAMSTQYIVQTKIK